MGAVQLFEDQFKEMRLWKRAVVQYEMRYQCIRDSDVHVGHENSR